MSQGSTPVARRAPSAWNVANGLTVLRLLLVPVFGILLSLLILRELMFGPRRFGEIKANLVGISANVLTQRLEGLERAGILVRRRLPPPASFVFGTSVTTASTVISATTVTATAPGASTPTTIAART